MNSITRYGSGCSSTAYTWTMFSCRTLAEDRASRRNRLRAGEVAAICGAQHLDRDHALERLVEGAEHDAEAPLAEDFEDLVMSEAAEGIGPGRRLQEIEGVVRLVLVVRGRRAVDSLG